MERQPRNKVPQEPVVIPRSTDGQYVPTPGLVIRFDKSAGTSPFEPPVVPGPAQDSHAWMRPTQRTDSHAPRLERP